jgi:hypothetical protein
MQSQRQVHRTVFNFQGWFPLATLCAKHDGVYSRGRFSIVQVRR